MSGLTFPRALSAPARAPWPLAPLCPLLPTTARLTPVHPAGSAPSPGKTSSILNAPPGVGQCSFSPSSTPRLQLLVYDPDDDAARKPFPSRLHVPRAWPPFFKNRVG